MNLKIKLNHGTRFLAHGTQSDVLQIILQGLKDGSIKLPNKLENDKPSFVCFRLDESDLKQLSKISDKYRLSMAEILRESLKQLNLIAPTEK